MWLVVGLGNPGPAYRDTRHNLGASTVTALARRLDCRLRRGKGAYLLGEAGRRGEPFLLAVTTTYMNVSGPAVAALVAERGGGCEELVVLLDDFYLPLARLRLRPAGGDGGHKGLASVIEALGTRNFARLRMGVGEPPEGLEAADWVLQPFEPAEQPAVDEMIGRAGEAVEVLVREGLPRAMGLANRQPEGERWDTTS